MRAILYDAKGQDRDVDLGSTNLSTLGTDQLLWIITSPEEASATLMPEDISRAVLSRRYAQALELRERSYEFSLPVLKRAENDGSEIRFVVGTTWLLTICDPTPDYMSRFLEMDEGENLRGRLSPTALAAALILEHLNVYKGDLIAVEKAIDKLDETVLRAREKRAPLSTLAVLRRRVSSLRANLSEMGEVVQAFNRPDFKEHIGGADAAHFKQIQYVFDRLEDMVARVREAIVSSYDLYDTRVSQDTNRLIKALTIITVMTGVIGAVAGIFGMNFDLPFEHTGMTGFIAVTAAMLIAALAVLVVSLWRRWF